ncbi:flagellar motor switch protein [Sulfitobacter sp. PS-8MA]|uniref:flagellar motor switch protein n=1 Tax=Sulfitobacter sp. PS-8MA TaxID=3237707 RepID=UPI0034C622E3
MMSALIDIIIIVLLIGTLVYAFILDRRVRNLMASLKDMEPMVGAFSTAVDQSAKSVEELRDLSTQARRPEPPVQKQAPQPRPQTVAPAPGGESPAQKRAARLKNRAPVQGQAAVQGKSELVRTFFDITKERKE